MSDIMVKNTKKAKLDVYSNVAYKRVTSSAANALTFEALSFAVGLFQGVALLVNRILYTPLNAALRELVAATDSLDMGITTSNRLSGIDPATDPAVIDVQRITCIAANTEYIKVPIISDLTGLPGGGKLVGANPLYLAIQSSGFANPAAMDVQLEFQFMELSPAQYLELIQAQFPANIV